MAKTNSKRQAQKTRPVVNDAEPSHATVANLGSFVLYVAPLAGLKSATQSVVAPDRSPERSAKSSHRERRCRIELVGDDAPKIRRALRQFFEIGRALENCPAPSLTKAAAELERRFETEKCPPAIPVSAGHSSKLLKIARRYFAREHGLETLLLHKGVGRSYEGLTDQGKQALEMTREYLVEQQLITEDR